MNEDKMLVSFLFYFSSSSKLAITTGRSVAHLSSSAADVQLRENSNGGTYDNGRSLPTMHSKSPEKDLF